MLGSIITFTSGSIRTVPQAIERVARDHEFFICRHHVAGDTRGSTGDARAPLRSLPVG